MSNGLIAKVPAVTQCAWCWKIKDDAGEYTIPADRLVLPASHGICDPCCDRVLQEPVR